MALPDPHEDCAQRACECVVERMDSAEDESRRLRRINRRYRDALQRIERSPLAGIGSRAQKIAREALEAPL